MMRDRNGTGPSLAAGLVAMALALGLPACGVSAARSPATGASATDGAMEPATVPATDGGTRDHTAEIEGFEARRAQIDADLDSDPRIAGSMAEMSAAEADHASSLESLMSEVYAYVSALPGMDISDLSATQDAWEASWRERYDAMRAEFEAAPYSGNSFALQVSSEHARRIGKRIDELLDVARAAAGTDATVPTAPAA